MQSLHIKMPNITLSGFHGTSKINAESIVKGDFRLSLGDDEWLGDGVYFFTEGIPPTPQLHARRWAIASAWDKSKGQFSYDEYAVVKAEINMDKNKLLDLTTLEGIRFFNYLRDRYIKLVAKDGVRLRRGSFEDGHVINDARTYLNMNIDATKGNFYIKFKTERIFNINFRTPNATILAVFNVNIIDKDTRLIVSKGKITDEIRRL